MGRKRRVVIGVVAVLLIAGYLVLGRVGTSSLDLVQRKVGHECGEPARHGDVLLLAMVADDPAMAECRRSLRSALIDAGWTSLEADRAVVGRSGAVESGRLRVAHVTDRPRDPDGAPEITVIEIADCRRVLIPLRTDEWAAGAPWDGLLRSPCDEPFDPGWANADSMPRAGLRDRVDATGVDPKEGYDDIG